MNRAVELLIVKLAQLVAISGIREIDLNPVLADETGVIAVDARVSVAPLEGIRRGPSVILDLPSNLIRRSGSARRRCATAERC